MRVVQLAARVFNEKIGDACFLWCGDCVDSPVQVVPVVGMHRRGCRVCQGEPERGQVYLKSFCDIGVALNGTDLKLCQTCAVGLLQAAVGPLEQGALQAKLSQLGATLEPTEFGFDRGRLKRRRPGSVTWELV